VYSFSILLWEVGTLEKPYGRSFSCLESAERVVARRGVRPPLDSVPESLKSVLRQGWHEDPGKRPTFETISHLLDND